MTRQRESFIFYRSFKESIADLSDSDRLLMFESICDYALDMTEPVLSGFPNTLFKLIRPQLDANLRRWENGCKGGPPLGNQNARKQPKNNLETTKKQANENVNHNDTANQKKKTTRLMTEDELLFHEKMKEKYPLVMSMREPLSLEQYQRLVSEFGKVDVISKLEAMENYKPLLQKNNSANRTIRNWMKRDQHKN